MEGVVRYKRDRSWQSWARDPCSVPCMLSQTTADDRWMSHSTEVKRHTMSKLVLISQGPRATRNAAHRTRESATTGEKTRVEGTIAGARRVGSG